MDLILKLSLLQVSLFIQLLNCNGQSLSSQLNYTAPFDSIHVEFFKDRINKGYSHLLLIKTPQGFDESFYLISTEWYTPNYTDKMNFEDVNNLLNGKINEQDRSGLFPITLNQIDFYKEKTTCDLIKEVFDKHGFFQSSADYYSSNVVLLSVLVKRGLQISLSDIDGEPIIEFGSTGCN